MKGVEFDTQTIVCTIAFSTRTTNFDQITVFCNENQIEDDYILFSNIVYNELFN